MKRIVPPEMPAVPPGTLNYAQGKYPNKARKDPRRATKVAETIAFSVLVYIVTGICALRAPISSLIPRMLAPIFPLALVGSVVGVVLGAIHFNAPWPYRDRARLVVVVSALELLALLSLLGVVALAGAVMGGRY